MNVFKVNKEIIYECIQGDKERLFGSESNDLLRSRV